MEFHGLHNLNRIMLHNTRIYTIHSGAFLFTNIVYMVDLSSNNLQNINSGVFQGLSELIFLNLSGNNELYVTLDLFTYTSAL